MTRDISGGTEIREIIFRERVDGIFEDGTGFVIEEGSYRPLYTENDRGIFNKSFCISLGNLEKTVSIDLANLLPLINNKVVQVLHSSEDDATDFSEIMKIYLDMLEIKRSAP